MNLKQAKQRIEELERKVRELEAQPKQVFEYHYHYPAYQPQPIYPYITWGNDSVSTASSFVTASGHFQ